jgi:hypothetical protein
VRNIVRTYNFHTSFKLTITPLEIRIKFQKGASKERCLLLENEIFRLIEGISFGENTLRKKMSLGGFTLYNDSKSKHLTLTFSEEFQKEWKSYV